MCIASGSSVVLSSRDCPLPSEIEIGGWISFPFPFSALVDAGVVWVGVLREVEDEAEEERVEVGEEEREHA